MLPHICYVNHPLDLTLYKVIYGRCHIYIDIDMHVFFCCFCKVSAMSPFPVAAPTLHFQLPLQLFISSCRSSSSFPVAACGWRRLWLARSSPAAVPPLAAAAALDAAIPGSGDPIDQRGRHLRLRFDRICSCTVELCVLASFPDPPAPRTNSDLEMRTKTDA